MSERIELSQVKFPQIYAVEIGHLTINAVATTPELAVTNSLYWLDENAKSYDLDSAQHIMPEILNVDLTYDTELTARIISSFGGNIPYLKGIRTIPSKKAQVKQRYSKNFEQLQLF